MGLTQTPHGLPDDQATESFGHQGTDHAANRSTLATHARCQGSQGVFDVLGRGDELAAEFGGLPHATGAHEQPGAGGFLHGGDPAGNSRVAQAERGTGTGVGPVAHHGQEQQEVVDVVPHPALRPFVRVPDSDRMCIFAQGQPGSGH